MKLTARGDRWFCFHGAFLSATIYPALAESSQVIAVDLQGHGRTADIDRPLTFEQMADDVRQPSWQS